MGLDDKQRKVLIALYPGKSLNQSELSNSLDIFNRTAKNWAEPLIEDGLVEMNEVVEDKRVKNLYSLTDEGWKVARKVVGKQREHHLEKAEEMQDKLDKGELLKQEKDN